jgi:activator of HSP90 ATPase
VNLIATCGAISVRIGFAVAIGLSREERMKTKTIRQKLTFKGSAHDVYELLMDSKKHSELVGASARISKKVGAKFSVYDGEIDGVNLELVPDKKIVQSWRYSNWPEGHYSKATFLIEEGGGETQLTFTQTGVPEEHYKDIAQGWHDYYWTPMKKTLAKGKK